MIYTETIFLLLDFSPRPTSHRHVHVLLVLRPAGLLTRLLPNCSWPTALPSQIYKAACTSSHVYITLQLHVIHETHGSGSPTTHTGVSSLVLSHSQVRFFSLFSPVSCSLDSLSRCRLLLHPTPTQHGARSLARKGVMFWVTWIENKGLTSSPYFLWKKHVVSQNMAFLHHSRALFLFQANIVAPLPSNLSESFTWR